MSGIDRSRNALKVMRDFSTCLKHEFLTSAKPLFLTYFLGIISLLILFLGQMPPPFLTESSQTQVFYPAFSFILPSLLEIALMTLCFLSFLAFGILLIVRVFQTFWIEIFGSQGYLTLTLPVSLDCILLSKILIYALWGVFSFFFGFAFVCLLVDSSLLWSMHWDQVLSRFWSSFVGMVYGISFVLFITSLLNAMRVRTFVLLKGFLLALVVNVPLSMFASTLDSMQIFGFETIILSCVCYVLARYLIIYKLELE